MKVGRNDPCPCGSGKKYKKCCLIAVEAQPVEDFHWHKLRRAIEALPTQLLKFSSKHFGEAGLHEAWDEFTDWEGIEFDPETPHITIFMPWFFYDWTPDPLVTNVRREALDECTLAQAYLEKKGKQLEPLLRRYIEQCCKAPFSFYDILSVCPGEGFLLRDIITGEEVDVTEHSGSTQAKAGDIMFGKVAQLDDLAVMEASPPVFFPPREKQAILDLRKKIHGCKLPLTPVLIKDYDNEMLGIYHDITERLLSSAMPELVNTDGDSLVPQELIYEIESPHATFDALKHLSICVSEDELLAEAKFNTKGELRAVDFSWQKKGNVLHKSWENTVLAYIRINGHKMKVEVNSDNRAKKFRALMDELLPGKVRYKTTVIESLQI